MAGCSNCGAPLRADSNVCIYCRTRNDVDLRGKHDYSVREGASARICPHCDIPLKTLELAGADSLTVERCGACLGLFLDHGEIEVLLERSVSNVFAVNEAQLQSVAEERYRKPGAVKYVRCPVCRSFMKRNVYGYRSGVVIDSCQAHGIWLDGGEIAHLAEWKKAGGELLQTRVVGQKARSRSEPLGGRDFGNGVPLAGNRSPSHEAEAELLDAAVGFLFRLFR